MTQRFSDFGDSVTRYPDIVEYNEAIQHPDTAFIDPELRRGKVRETNLGLPLALSGGFALTYTVTTPSRKLAVRCFHRQVPEAESKYAAIANKLKSSQSDYFVDFSYLPTGIKVRNGIYPIVRMDWVEGDTLGIYLDKNADKPEQLRKLRSEFQSLAAYLEKEGIAHGDIQNGNVMVSSNGSVKLIDYDGMYVTGMPTGNGNELGHKHFQHPSRTPSHFGPKMDRFSFIALDLSLMVLMENGALHQRFREGGETIIFKGNDFADPHNAEIFRLLSTKSSLKQYVVNFTSICEGSIHAIPTLADFLAGKNIPSARTVKASPEYKQTPSTIKNIGYISPFDVVDATDFETALKNVGNRVELIGQIVAVKGGVGKRGRGKAKPFVFINFGNWTGNITKVSIWSEGLAQFAEPPSEKWVGKWISVVGLMDPPYHGRHYASRYTHVGITITDSNQTNFLSEKEARFRLASIGKPLTSRGNTGTSPGVTATKPSSGLPSTTGSVQPRPPAGITANALLLDKIKRSQSGGASYPSTTGPAHPTASTPPLASQHPSRRIPVRTWIRVAMRELGRYLGRTTPFQWWDCLTPLQRIAICLTLFCSLLFWRYGTEKRTPLISTPTAASKQEGLAGDTTLLSAKDSLVRKDRAPEFEHPLEKKRKQASPSPPLTASTSIRPQSKSGETITPLPPYKALGSSSEVGVTQKIETPTWETDTLKDGPEEASLLPIQEGDITTNKFENRSDNQAASLAEGSTVLERTSTESAVSAKEIQPMEEIHASTSNPDEVKEKPKLPNQRYLNLIQRRISSLWVEPSNTPEVAPFDVLVRFRLNRSGHITDVSIEHSSGDEAYDLAAKRAVLSASPLPSFPPDMDLEFLNAHLNFSSRSNASTP